ncbi:hypothetical protein RJ640_025543 [Escallonia rubra]|uniref:X8 domain-containing protein n=1 Tax=Escallonia rubra TaxID=112253 RepID=A0AA88UF01_9ASTE|nr:hypothetical protein RJ640_025543 [Escallonia rubra]
MGGFRFPVAAGDRVLLLLLLVLVIAMVDSVSGIGANWGTQVSHPLPPETVVRMLRENGIKKVKLFDADYGALRALGKSGIEVMVGIPNEMLASLASSMKAAERWVSKNVSTHITGSNVDISALSFSWDPDKRNASVKEVALEICRIAGKSLEKAISGASSLAFFFAISTLSKIFSLKEEEMRIENKGIRDEARENYRRNLTASCMLHLYDSGEGRLVVNLTMSYVAVGNEPFLQTYNGTFLRTTFPALQNIQSALIKAGLSNKVKVTVPLNGDVYESASGPSGGDFRADIRDYMIQIVKFLSDNGAPFTVNIYPFISLYADSNFPVEYAFFDGNASPINDGGTNYYNMFDANLDTLVWALQKNGFANMPIIVGEIGWPTDGDRNANLVYAQRFNQGFMSHISGGKGTPMRPGPIDVYLFSLIDEDEKSVDPGNFERHWGIFFLDGQPKYQLNLGTINSSYLAPARNVHYLEKKWCVMKPSAGLDDPQVALSVSYACALADCTSLGYQTSCGNLDARGNISYALNSYFQKNNQLDRACKFPNLSTIVTTDPSTESCRFGVMIQQYYGGAGRIQKGWGVVAGVCLFLLTTF